MRPFTPRSWSRRLNSSRTASLPFSAQHQGQEETEIERDERPGDGRGRHAADDPDPGRILVLALEAIGRAARRQLARLVEVVARVVVVRIEGERPLELPDRRPQRALA